MWINNAASNINILKASALLRKKKIILQAIQSLKWYAKVCSKLQPNLNCENPRLLQNWFYKVPDITAFSSYGLTGGCARKF